MDVYICRFWTRFHSDECVAGTKRTSSRCEVRLPSTDAFLRSEAVIYFRFMTLHFTQTYSSLWFPFGKPCLLGLAVPQHFLPLRYSPFFTLPFCLLIGKSLLTLLIQSVSYVNKSLFFIISTSMTY